MERLRRNIEVVREKLDDAVKEGYDEQTCYSLSVELDQLIETYIIRIQEGFSSGILENKTDKPVGASLPPLS